MKTRILSLILIIALVGLNVDVVKTEQTALFSGFHFFTGKKTTATEEKWVWETFSSEVEVMENKVVSEVAQLDCCAT